MTVGSEAPPSRSFRSISTETLPRQVARAIVGSILLGRFKPGDELPAAAEFARDFEVSVPVVREALKIIATLGMVTSRQGRYSRVAERDLWNELAPDLVAVRLEVGAVDDILSDSLELRRVIETEAAALAAERATDADRLALRQEYEELSRVTRDTEAYTQHDVAFHDAILRATHNRLLLQLIEQMRDVLVLARTLSVTADADLVPASYRGHGELLAAIEERSPERARRAMADHLGWAERVNVAERPGGGRAKAGRAGFAPSASSEFA